MSRARKPLRRTAWSLLLGGLGVAALLLGIGAVVVGGGEPAGPGRLATWPAGAEIAVERPVGVQRDGRAFADIACTVTPRGESARQVATRWQERMRPDFTGPATITCDVPVRVLTGAAITVATVTRGPLVAVPVMAAGLGVLFFFPRFTAFAAGLSHPFGRLVDRLTGRRRGL